MNLINNLIKIISIIMLISLLVLFIIPNNVQAGEFLNAGEDFLNTGKKQGSAIKTSGLQEISNFLLSILIPVGIVASVIVTGILGLQLMFGSMENKAEVKESLLPWGISIVVLFSAYTIWKVVVNILASFG